MTQIGTVIDGKYEILKEIGKGGMSIVYLAMDKHLNKQWAVKEIRKRGNGKNDEVVVNSLLAEANLMKRLDHPALPRIVDIIDNGITIYVVMDYIEGESLDKILNEFGAQSEEMVISWAKQLCDALSYLHSQKPSIIYRDMKPANIMLKPEGNIKIIDFGIAREYKEQNLSDTTVLGTKGYAPPEQYSGQTDPRSDIFALGMTLHHLLTGVDPRNGEPYAPVRAWNPNISEGIEIIIDKCVEPAAENRYQNCADLLYDLEHPELITSGYKKKQKRKLTTFLLSAALSIVMAVSGVAFNIASTNVSNNNYENLISQNKVSSCLTAIEQDSNRIDAYKKAIDILLNSPEPEVKEIDQIVNALSSAMSNEYLNIDDPVVARMCYDASKLRIVYKSGANNFSGETETLLQYATESNANYEGKEIASFYYSLCEIANKGGSKNVVASEYEEIFNKFTNAINIVNSYEEDERDYNRYTLYFTIITFINNNRDKIISSQLDGIYVTDFMYDIANRCATEHPTNPLAINLKKRTEASIDIQNFKIKYMSYWPDYTGEWPYYE